MLDTVIRYAVIRYTVGNIRYTLCDYTLYGLYGSVCLRLRYSDYHLILTCLVSLYGGSIQYTVYMHNYNIQFLLPEEELS
jgi:hypothetical protein